MWLVFGSGINALSLLNTDLVVVVVVVVVFRAKPFKKAKALGSVV